MLRRLRYSFLTNSVLLPLPCGCHFRLALNNLQTTINTEPTDCQRNCTYDAC
jgi:hypothetical protein